MDNLNQFSKVIAQVSDLLAPLAGDSEGSFDPASFELTYNEDRHYDGKLYSIAIPDGFVFDRKESGRDFHAWLPNPENPQEEYMALVSIKPSVEIDLPDTGFEIRTPRLLHAVFSLVMVATASALATDPLMKNSKNLQLTLGDLETHCNYLPDPVSAHFYVNICMHGKFKQFRIDMRGVTEKNEAASLALVQKILMKVELKEPPFQPLKKLTDASYTESPLTEKAVREWAELLNTYLDQENKAFMVNTRTMEQEVPQRAKEGVLAPEWIDEEAARIRKDCARS